MTNNLAEHFQKIWDTEIKKVSNSGLNYAIPLKTITDTITKWERLLSSFYKQLPLNTVECSRDLSNALGVASRLLARAGFMVQQHNSWLLHGRKQALSNRKPLIKFIALVWHFTFRNYIFNKLIKGRHFGDNYLHWLTITSKDILEVEPELF